MEVVRACAACLVTDVRMYSMSAAAGLLDAYQFLTGAPQYDARMPEQLCWECAALVKKFNVFRDKCERAYLLLQDIYSSNKENQEQIIRRIDRHTCLLTSSLTFNKMKCINFDSTVNGFDCEDYNNEKFSQFHSEDDNDNHEFEIDIKKEEDVAVEISPSDLFVDLDCVKVEDTKATREHHKRRRKNKSERKEKKDKLSKETSDKKKRGRETKDSKIERKVRKQKLKKAKVKQMKVKRKRAQPNKKIECSEFATEVMLTQEQQIEEVRKRQETAGYREARFQCNLCYKGYIDEKTYSNHMLKHDPVSGSYQCDVCKNRFKQRRHVVNHIYKVHMSKYLCKFCPYVSQSPEQASNHNKWHTGVTYKCDLCSEVFTKRSTHLSHVRIKHPSQHICGACGDSFVSGRGLVLHTRLMHKEAEGSAGAAAAAAAAGPYCADCRVQFTSAAAWKRHMIISPKHADDQQFLNGCRECGESFASAAALRLHARAHARRRRRVVRNAPVQHFPAPCAECSEPVENAMQYWQHFRRAHPDQKYPAQNSVICEYCGKGFQTNALLVYHRHTHTGKRSYQCAACPKSFFNPASLATHARSHDESRPHTCAVCRKAFKVKPALARHARIHTGEKPYACEVCGKAFSDASSRKLHVRTVHLKAPPPPPPPHKYSYQE